MQHNDKLGEAISELWRNCPGVVRIEIEIEMPLNSGVQLIATGLFGAEKKGLRVRNARSFYAALKDDVSDGAWNRMHIEVLSPNEFNAKKWFDVALRDETIEQVR